MINFLFGGGLLTTTDYLPSALISSALLCNATPA
jgi:hypothetical protein